MTGDDHYAIISADCHAGGRSPICPTNPTMALLEGVRRAS